MLEALKIVGLCVLAAISFGVVHDQITARVCLEYFTVGHADVAGHEPTIVALYWGVVATWWVGLPLGIVLAIAARAGESRRPVTARELAPRVAILMASLLAFAMLAGLVGYARAASGVDALGSFDERLPAPARLGFVFDAWAHGASYLGGILGGLALCVATFFGRAPSTTVDGTPIGTAENRVLGVGCFCGLLAPLLAVYALLLGNQILYFGAGESLAELGLVGYAVWHGTPWIELALALLGGAVVVRLITRALATSR